MTTIAQSPMERLNAIIDKFHVDSSKEEMKDKISRFQSTQDRVSAQEQIVKNLQSKGLETQQKLEQMSNELATEHDELLQLMENGMKCEQIENFDEEMRKLEMMKSRMAQVYELLKDAQIKELYLVNDPPEDCKNLMKCILILLNNEENEFGWSACRLFLQKPNFKQVLQSFDIDNIPQHHIDRLSPLISKANFNFDAQKKNGACTAYLTEWVNKVVEYHNLYQQLKPYFGQQE